MRRTVNGVPRDDQHPAPAPAVECVQQHAPQTETELKVLYEACGRASEACGHGRRMAAAMWSLQQPPLAAPRTDGGPALRLDDLPAAAAAPAGGPTAALLGRRPAPSTQAARRRPGERGSARCAAAPFGVASRAGVAAAAANNSRLGARPRLNRESAN